MEKLKAKKKDKSFSSLIKIILFFSLFLFFLFFSYQFLNSTFTPHHNYCYNYRHNDSFMDNFVDGSDPLQNIDCDSTLDRIGWTQFCNSSCMKKLDRCIYELPFEERNFMRTCSWGADFMIFFAMLFLITVSGLFLFSFIFEIKEIYKKRKNVKKKNN